MESSTLRLQGAYPCKIFTEISPRSRHDVRWILNISEIAARYLPSRRDCRELAEIAEFAPRLQRSRHDILNLGEIAARYPPSRRDYRDLAEICRDLTTMFEKPTNVMARSQWSRHDICWFLKSHRVCGEIFYIYLSRDWRDPAVKFDSFCILPRFWKTQTSYRDCQNITQSFPDGMNNFPPWI